MVINGREEVPPKLEKLECLEVGSVGEVGEAEGDGNAVAVGLPTMDSGGCGLKGGGKGNFGWSVDGKGGDDGAVPMQGGWIGQER